MVFSACYAYHRNPEIWDNPDEFNYKRWLIEDNTKLKSQIMVFSQGPRGCPGRALGWMELFFIVAAIAQRYEYKLCKGQEKLGDKPIAYFMMKPSTYSIKVEMKHRKKQ
jgi:cytochrome P450